MVNSLKTVPFMRMLKSEQQHFYHHHVAQIAFFLFKSAPQSSKYFHVIRLFIFFGKAGARNISQRQHF